MARRLLPLPFAVDIRPTMSLLRHGRHDPTIRLNPREVLRAMRTPDGPVTIHARRSNEDLAVEAWGPGTDWALEHAPGLLGFLDERHGFDPQDELVARLHKLGDGVRIPRTGRVLESLIPAILGQRVTGFEAQRSYHQLIERWGEPAPGPGGLLLQPRPEQIAELAYYELHVVGVERRRADTLKRACAHAQRLEAVAPSGSAALRERLESIPGIGPWSSAETARAALGDPDAVSVGDYHLKNIVSFALAGEPTGSDARMLELLEPYAGHRGRVCRLLELARLGPPRHNPRQGIEPIRSR
jgi:3-methyladenine DNA glycosylase/8-oxoguanine DNA glycosylase